MHYDSMYTICSIVKIIVMYVKFAACVMLMPPSFPFAQLKLAWFCFKAAVIVVDV